MDEPTFTVERAREVLSELLPTVSELITLRADLTELGHDRERYGHSPLGGTAEAKALEARISELVERISARGVELKGLAPLLLDFPSVLGGKSVRLCWIEGERSLDWYHLSELGLAGRRRLPRTPSAS